MSSDKNGNGNGNGFNFARHLNWSNIPVEHPADGIERQMFVGNRMMICRFRFKPFLETPEHDHPHEQMTIVERNCGRRAALPVELLARRDDDG
jgi:hypothetical protein